MADDRNNANPDAEEVDALLSGGDDIDKAVADAFAASEPEADEGGSGDDAGGQPRDEHGRFTSKDTPGEDDPPKGDAQPAGGDGEGGGEDSGANDSDDAAPDADQNALPSADASDEGGDDGTTSLDPPHHWSAADQEAFRAQPAEVQQWMLDRHKQMEADYTTKTQEIAPLRSTMERWSPYVRQNGSTPEQAFDTLMQTEYLLRTGTAAQKRDTLMQVAHTYGVELGQQQAQQQQQQYDPDDPIMTHPFVQQLQQGLAEAREQNQQIMGTLQQWQQGQQQQVVQNGNQAIDAFRAEKDASGNPAHPYFDEVVDDMVAMAAAEKQRGKTPVLKDLYERAIWANPEVRAKVQGAERAATARAEAERKKREAEKARKAGVSVSGSPSSPQTKPKTLDEEVSEAMGAS